MWKRNRARRESRSNDAEGWGADARGGDGEPARAGSMPTTQMVQKSPPPTPMPSQLSPRMRAESGTPLVTSSSATSPRAATSANAEYIIGALDVYPDGIYGLLFGLKDDRRTIRGATIEIAKTRAFIDATLGDTPSARFWKLAMG